MYNFFVKVYAFTKTFGKNDLAERVHIFTKNDLQKFFIDAWHITYLFFKVVNICSIFDFWKGCE